MSLLSFSSLLRLNVRKIYGTCQAELGRAMEGYVRYRWCCFSVMFYIAWDSFQTNYHQGVRFVHNDYGGNHKSCLE